MDDYCQYIDGESAGGNQAEGTWSNNAPGITAAEEGTYTAQAGGGAEEDIPVRKSSISFRLMLEKYRGGAREHLLRFLLLLNV